MFDPETNKHIAIFMIGVACGSWATIGVYFLGRWMERRKHGTP